MMCGARIESIVAEIDRQLAAQINLILHHPEFQQIEASWRGLRFLVDSTETGPLLKIKLLDISKRELRRSLRKFHGTAWDQSPLFAGSMRRSSASSAANRMAC